MDKNTRLVAMLLIALIAGCGGGGGGDDEDDEQDFDQDATGIWTGTVTPDGKPAVSAEVVVAPDGRFVAVSAFAFLSGSGSVSGDRLSASAKGWTPPGSTFANGSTSATFSLTGTVLQENRIDSAYSGGGESGRIAATYHDARSNREASLAVAAGSYVTSGGGALAINSTGAMTLNSPNGPNCVGNGTLQVPNRLRNVYKWSMTLSGCTAGNGNAEGVGYMGDIGSRLNSRIVLLGAAPDVSIGIIAEK